jgi:hypothetical protein
MEMRKIRTEDEAACPPPLPRWHFHGCDSFVLGATRQGSEVTANIVAVLYNSLLFEDIYPVRTCGLILLSGNKLSPRLFQNTLGTTSNHNRACL